MARFTPIRIRQKDQEEYKRLVRNTKAKIRRVRKKYNVDLTADVNLPSIDSFKTRKEFNIWREQQKSFTNIANLNYQFVKNPYDVVATKKEILEVKQDIKKVQKRAEKIEKNVENKPFVSGGNIQGTVGQRMKQMSKPDVLGVKKPKELDFENIRTRSYFEDKKQSLKRQSDPKYLDRRTAQMKANFMEILLLSFNSNASELVRKLNDLPPDVFYDMYIRFDEFDFSYYDSEGQVVDGVEDNISQMLADIERYEKGELNMDLKSF